MASAAQEHRNWAELPPDILSAIFKILGAFEVLLTAQAVCRCWWRLSLEPQIWWCVDLVNGDSDLYDNFDLGKLAKAPVDRSSGQLEKVYIKGVYEDGLLEYISDRTTLLRCLRLDSCGYINDGLIYLANKFPMLEELEVTDCLSSSRAYKHVGQCCPQLKCFTLITIRLLAILDGCPHLEFLDLRGCRDLHLEGNLLKRCERIKVFRHPDSAFFIHEFEKGDCSFDHDYFDDPDDYMEG